MDIFKNYTNEMMMKDKAAQKFSKKHYKLFINDLVDNLPNFIEKIKVKEPRLITILATLSSEILDGHVGYMAFEGLELNDIKLALMNSSSIEELEERIKTKTVKEYDFIQLIRTKKILEEDKETYLKRFEDFFYIIERIKKPASIKSFGKSGDLKDYYIYSTSPKRGNLSKHHLVYDLAQLFIDKENDVPSKVNISYIIDNKGEKVY